MARSDRSGIRRAFGWTEAEIERDRLRDEYIESGRAYRHKPPFQRGAEEARFYTAVDALEAWERAQGVEG